jgi:hypothetical protein
MASYWIVICPEPHVTGGLWARWYRENCVAVGWPPPEFGLAGGTENSGWAWTRDRLNQMRVGDKVIPFLLKWRIGPVGTVRELRVTDGDWSPTVDEGAYSRNPDQAELGRRVLVTWEQAGMPPDGKVAIVPANLRTGGPLARHTVEELPAVQFERLCSALSDASNWVDVAVPEPGTEAPVELPAPGLTVLNTTA